jgi:hypothetical protein
MGPQAGPDGERPCYAVANKACARDGRGPNRLRGTNMHPSKLCALSAALIFVSATAAMAQATQVNIADPTASSRKAKVETGGRLAVQEVPPASYFHAGGQVPAGVACTVFTAPPAGKALIVRQVRVSTFAPGSGSGYVAFYANTDCSVSGIVGEVDPNAIGGPFPVTFDPGVAIPSGGSFAVSNHTTYSLDVYVDGYAVSAGVAPAVAGQIIEAHGKMFGQH